MNIQKMKYKYINIKLKIIIYNNVLNYLDTT